MEAEPKRPTFSLDAGSLVETMVRSKKFGAVAR
jgi:hypothetical protein